MPYDRPNQLLETYGPPVAGLPANLGPDTLGAPPPRLPDELNPAPTRFSDYVRNGLLAIGTPRTTADRVADVMPYTPMGQGYDAGQLIARGADTGNAGNMLMGGGLGVLAALPFGVAPRMAGPVRVPNPIRAYHGSPYLFAAEEGAPLGRFRLGGSGGGFNGFSGAGGGFAPGVFLAESEPLAVGYRDYLRDLAASRMPWWQRWWRNPPSGHVYETNIHAQPNQILDWASPLDQIPADARSALRPFETSPRTLELLGEDADTVGQILSYSPRRHEATDALRNAGYHGMSFRIPPSAPDRQFAVWSPEIIEILRRYGLVGPAAGVTGNALLGERPQ